MIIRDLRLDHFGKFDHQSITLNPGINVIQGDNEAGKSTVYGFIRCMLFGAEKLRGRGAGKDDYTRFMPWEGGSYEGRLIYNCTGKNYRIVRDFAKNNMTFTLIDEATGNVLASDGDDISKYIPGMTASNFRNSIGVGQMEASPDMRFSENMQTYMANMAMGANEAVDVSKAMIYLRDERKRINALLPDERIRENEEKIARISEQMAEIPQLTARQQSLLDEAAKLKAEEDALIAKAEAERKDDQSQRFEAARLIQQNNDITSRYREKKAQLHEIEQTSIKEAREKMAGVIAACEKRAQQMSDAEVRVGELESELQSAPLKHLALILPVIAIAICVGLAGNMIGLDNRSRILWPVILVVAAAAMLLIMTLFQSGKKRRLAGLRADVQMLAAAQQKDFAIYDVSSVEGLRRIASASGQQQAEMNRIRQELTSLRKQYDAIQEPLRPYIEKYGEIISTDSLAGEVTRSQADVLKKQREDLTKQAEQIEWQLEHLLGQQAEMTALEELNQQMTADRHELDQDLEAVELCANTLREITQTIHGTFGEEMNAYVSSLLETLTGGVHKRLVIDENFRILVDDGKNLLTPQQLSGGTADQMWFAARMAVSQLFFEEKMPLILDDSFVSYDDKRLENTLRWLSTQEVFSQVIIFSCQHREAQIMEKAGIDFNLCQL